MASILDLGCGSRKEHWIPNSDGLDLKDFGQEYVWNLESLDSWPIEDNTYNKVVANHIMEHIESADAFIHIMNEIWRVLKPGGIFEGASPHGLLSPNQSIDPYHCRVITEHSFKGFLEDNPYHFNDYGIVCIFRQHRVTVNSNKDVLWTLEAIK